MQVIVDYFQLSQMKSCRKEPQRSRNYLLRQRTNSFNKIQNSFLFNLIAKRTTPQRVVLVFVVVCREYVCVGGLLWVIWGECVS